MQGQTSLSRPSTRFIALTRVAVEANTKGKELTFSCGALAAGECSNQNRSLRVQSIVERLRVLLMYFIDHPHAVIVLKLHCKRVDKRCALRRPKSVQSMRVDRRRCLCLLRQPADSVLQRHNEPRWARHDGVTRLRLTPRRRKPTWVYLAARTVAHPGLFIASFQVFTRARGRGHQAVLGHF